MGNRRRCRLSSVDFDSEVATVRGCEYHGLDCGWRRQLHRFGTWLGACDRYYRITLGVARRRVVRDHSAFREWAIFAGLGFAIEVGILIIGFWFFFAAQQEHERIAEQRRQQEQRQHELDRQSFFVRAVGPIVERSEY